MHYEQVATERDVAEHRFELTIDGEAVPGLLWRPEHATAPTPLVLLGHGGTQHKRTPNILGLARRFVRHLGYTAVSIDAPGHGDRVRDHEAAEAARVDLERRVTGAAGEAAAVRDSSSWAARMRDAPHQRASLEWSVVLDALVASDGLVDDRIGYWGVSMGTMIGLPFVANDRRVRCAVLGLACLEGWPDAELRRDAARRLEVPVLFVLQWDDQLMTRQSGLDLFDAIGSRDKVLHAFPGGHVATPLSERDAYDAFFARHLGSGAAALADGVAATGAARTS